MRDGLRRAASAAEVPVRPALYAGPGVISIHGAIAARRGFSFVGSGGMREYGFLTKCCMKRPGIKRGPYGAASGGITYVFSLADFSRLVL
jgi:hypothetical protein